MSTDDKDAEIARLQAFIIALAEHLAICSEELSRCAEKWTDERDAWRWDRRGTQG